MSTVKKFDFNKLSYLSYSRFIGLLSLKNQFKFKLTNKSNYINTIKINKIITLVDNWYCTKNNPCASFYHEYMSIDAADNEDYQKILKKYLKFVPYLKVFQLGIMGVPDFKIDKTYTKLNILIPKVMDVICEIYDRYYHPGLEFVGVYFGQNDGSDDYHSNVEKCIKASMKKFSATKSIFFRTWKDINFNSYIRNFLNSPTNKVERIEITIGFSDPSVWEKVI